MALRIWINAFIPKNVPNYTRMLSTGPLAGKTAIPLPRAANFNPVNLVKSIINTFDVGYLTDQRDFSTLPGASVRMRSWAELDPASLSVTTKGHESSGTTEVDLANGKQLGFKVADMSRCQWGTRVLGAAPASPSAAFPSPVMPGPGGGGFLGNSVVLTLVAAASDPLVSAAADIDYEGEFIITRGSNLGQILVNFNGKIDSFPAFEAYASLNGVTKTLFQSPPPPGNTVMSLPGKANRPVTGKVSFP